MAVVSVISPIDRTQQKYFLWTYFVVVAVGGLGWSFLFKNVCGLGYCFIIVPLPMRSTPHAYHLHYQIPDNLYCILVFFNLAGKK